MSEPVQLPTVIATVTGNDLLKSLGDLQRQYGRIESMVSPIPAHVSENIERITKLELWKAKVTGALTLLSVLSTGTIITVILEILSHKH